MLINAMWLCISVVLIFYGCNMYSTAHTMFTSAHTSFSGDFCNVLYIVVCVQENKIL